MEIIGILNYGMGNTRSVLNALEYVGANARLIPPEDIDACEALVLPGVGAFRDTSALLEPYKGDLISYIDSGKPFLGICVGLQYLYRESEENGTWNGLGIFNGLVRKLDTRKLPQIGWNTLDIRNANPLLEGVGSGSYVYYINSYGPEPDGADAVTQYGNEFAAMASRDNLFGTQFHPEKSGDVGLRMLRNFSRMV